MNVTVLISPGSTYDITVIHSSGGHWPPQYAFGLLLLSTVGWCRALAQTLGEQTEVSPALILEKTAHSHPKMESHQINNKIHEA
jgi:hypothetical protein